MLLKKIFVLLAISLNVSANEIGPLKIDLSGSGTPLNTCIVEQIKKLLPPTRNQKVVETGFAFSGTFVTHPLFSAVPVLFVTYQEDVLGSENEVKIIRDIHVAIPSFQRNGWQPNFQEQSVSAAVKGEAYMSIAENNGSLQIPMSLNISTCL